MLSLLGGAIALPLTASRPSWIRRSTEAAEGLTVRASEEDEEEEEEDGRGGGAVMVLLPAGECTPSSFAMEVGVRWMGSGVVSASPTAGEEAMDESEGWNCRWPVLCDEGGRESDSWEALLLPLAVAVAVVTLLSLLISMEALLLLPSRDLLNAGVGGARSVGVYQEEGR